MVRDDLLAPLFLPQQKKKDPRTGTRVDNLARARFMQSMYSFAVRFASSAKREIRARRASLLATLAGRCARLLRSHCAGLDSPRSGRLASPVAADAARPSLGRLATALAPPARPGGRSGRRGGRCDGSLTQGAASLRLPLGELVGLGLERSSRTRPNNVCE